MRHSLGPGHLSGIQDDVHEFPDTKAVKAATVLGSQVWVLNSDDQKFGWLHARVDQMLAKGQTLVFVKSKQAAQDRRELSWSRHGILQHVLTTTIEIDGFSRKMQLKSVREWLHAHSSFHRETISVRQPSADYVDPVFAVALSCRTEVAMICVSSCQCSWVHAYVHGKKGLVEHTAQPRWKANFARITGRHH